MCGVPFIGPFKREYIVTDIDNEKIIPQLKLMTKSEVMNDLLRLLDLVQKMPVRKIANIALIY
jgi:hypothetical protein